MSCSLAVVTMNICVVDDVELRKCLENNFVQCFQLSPKQDIRGTKSEHPMIGTTNQGQIHTNATTKQDNVTIKGLQANVSIPKVKLSFSEIFF